MNTIKNAVCPGCTILCDDVSFEVANRKIQSDIRCEMAQQWIGWANSEEGNADQSPVQMQTALEQIAGQLKQSRMPVVAGVANLTLQGQQIAWKIADVAGAVLGNTLGHQPQGSLYALQRQGKVSASLGEIANRGDLLIFWFCDPARTHPRLMERLKSKSDKTVVAIDSTQTQTAQAADHYIPVEQNDAIAFLSDARRLLSDENWNTDSFQISEVAKGVNNYAIPLDHLITLARKSTYGCFVYGHKPGPNMDVPLTLGHQKWVRQLNDHTRFVSIDLRADENAKSGENVISALSGYPVAVSMAKGSPQYCGDTWSVQRLLDRRQCDFLLLFAGRRLEAELASLSENAREHLAALPKAVFFSGPRPDAAVLNNAIVLQIAIPGATGSGDFCRLDNVLLPLKALRKTHLPSDQDALHQLFESLSR